MVRTEQYTSGGEFKLPNGTNYVGAYHVHVVRGAMVGAYHKETPHDRLTPSNNRVRRLIQNIIQQLQLENSSSKRSTGSSGSSGY
tara:strand:- start:14310 stop:14564 length:255 start_codon:yes stop_codon:yes gene_type:complete